MSCTGYNQATLANGTCITCDVDQHPDLATKTSCVAYGGDWVALKMARDLGSSINAGNTCFMLVGSAMVVFMTCGLALFYSSMVDPSNTVNTMMTTMITISVITLVWVCIGYSIAFAPGDGEFFGPASWGALTEISGDAISGVYASDGVPHTLFIFFQCAFAIITPGLLAGASVGRQTFGSFIVFICLWSLLVYSPMCRSLWALSYDRTTKEIVPAGFLAKLGVFDLAGGAVIHTSAGFSSLAMSLVIGSRLVRKEIKADATKTLIGTGVLLVGWYFFNSCSVGASNAAAGSAALATHIAVSAGIAVWLICEYIHTRKATLVGTCTAIVIALVAITPGANVVKPMAAIGVGGITALLAYLFNMLKTAYLSHLLDDVDVLLCHGVGGFVGLILTGVFADERAAGGLAGPINGKGILVAWQLAGATFAAVYSFCMSAVLMLLLKYTIGIRVDAETELNGLDRAHDSVDDVRDNSLAVKNADEPFCVMFTDVESSTRLYARSHTLMTRAMDMHNNILTKCAKEAGCYVVKTLGDSYMIASSCPAKMIKLALKVQVELFEADWGEDMLEFENAYRRWHTKGIDSDQNTVQTAYQQNPAAAAAGAGAGAGGGAQPKASALGPTTRRSSPTPQQQEEQQGGGGATVTAAATAAAGKSSLGFTTTLANANAAADNYSLWNGLRVRVGLCFGYGEVKYSPLTVSFDYFGTVVNAASRIESVGNGGQVLVNVETLTAAKKSDPELLKDAVEIPLGPVKLKGLKEAISLVQILPRKLASRRFPPLRLEKKKRGGKGGSSLSGSDSRSFSQSGVDSMGGSFSPRSAGHSEGEGEGGGGATRGEGGGIYRRSPAGSGSGSVREENFNDSPDDNDMDDLRNFHSKAANSASGPGGIYRSTSNKSILSTGSGVGGGGGGGDGDANNNSEKVSQAQSGELLNQAPHLVSVE